MDGRPDFRVSELTTIFVEFGPKKK